MAEVKRSINAYQASIELTNKRNDHLISTLREQVHTTGQTIQAWKEYQQINSQKVSSWEEKSESDKRELYDAINASAESLREVVSTQDIKVCRFESQLH